jgi:hypothetical protein
MPGTGSAGRALAWSLATALAAALLATGIYAADTLMLRYERDVSRMVFNDNLQLLDRLRRENSTGTDSLSFALASTAIPAADRPYIVVSIEEHRLWFRQGDSVLFTAEVATGSGRVLEGTGGDAHWRFETPRGRLAVIGKDLNPVWIAPDWYYVEEAQRRGLGLVRLNRGERIPTPDSGWVAVAGSDILKIDRDGKRTLITTGEGNEIVVGGNLVVPPFGTNQRKYQGVLGTHRLRLGDGYAIHGTNHPETVGRSVSHGCVRLRNEEIAALYAIVEVGTPVFIY